MHGFYTIWPLCSKLEEQSLEPHKTNAIVSKFQENISTELQNNNQKQFVTHLYSIKKFQYKLGVKRK